MNNSKVNREYMVKCLEEFATKDRYGHYKFTSKLTGKLFRVKFGKKSYRLERKGNSGRWYNVYAHTKKYYNDAEEIMVIMKRCLITATKL